MVLPRAVTSRAASCSEGGPMGTDGLLGWRNASKTVRSNASGSPSITSSAMRLKVIRSTAITRTDLNSDDSERHALKILCQASDMLFAPHGLDLPCITDVAAVTYRCKGRPWPDLRMSASGVRRDKAALSSGCKSHPATAPAGSNRSSYGGDEIAEAFGMRVTNW